MLGDRVLVSQDGESGERRSGGGIVIPARPRGQSACLGHRDGGRQHVRQVQVGDRVLSTPMTAARSSCTAAEYLLLREPTCTPSPPRGS